MPRDATRPDPNTTRDAQRGRDPTRRRAGRRMPKLRHHKHTGRAVVTVAGRDIYLGRWGTDEAEAAYHRVLAEYKATGRVDPVARGAANGPTVAELVLAYWRHAERLYDDRTLTGSLRPACRRLRRHYGPIAAADFTARDLRRLQLALTEEVGGSGRRLSRSYTNKLIARMKRIFKWGVAEGLVPASVWHELSTVEGLKKGTRGVRETGRVHAVSDETIERTLSELPSVVADMVRLQRRTGMRPGEVCRMSWNQIDTTGDVWLYRPTDHKNAHRDHEREVALGPLAQEVLAAYRDRPVDSAIFSPRENSQQVSARRREARKTPMTPSQRRRDARNAKKRPRAKDHYTTQGYAQAIRRACRRLGIDTWTPNQLRHAAATVARERLGLDAAYTLLGHKKPDTTLIYAERTRAARIELARRLG